MRLVCLFIAVGMLCGACDRQPRDTAEAAQAIKATAVTLSLQRFFAEDHSLRGPVIYIAPGPYASTVPKKLAGRSVEVISATDLIKRCGDRDVAPELVKINVYDEVSKPLIDFFVGVSISGVWEEGSQFNEIPRGTARTYEFSVVAGRPVLGRVYVESF